MRVGNLPLFSRLHGGHLAVIFSGTLAAQYRDTELILMVVFGNGGKTWRAFCVI